jgi:hypothetical protein
MMACRHTSQVVFEYLRLRFGRKVDGLVFPSVQTGEKGTNVVLFPQASIVSGLNFPQEEEDGEASEAKAAQPFESAARLCCITDSLRYYKITAISEPRFLSAETRPRPEDGSVLIYDTAADAFFLSVVAHALTTRTSIAMVTTPLRRVGCIECFAPCVCNRFIDPRNANGGCSPPCCRNVQSPCEIDE